MNASSLEKLLCAELRRQLGQNASPPKLPAGGELLWSWFLDLSRLRTYHPGGPNPISYRDIADYALVTGWPIAPRHISILLKMDETWRSGALGRTDATPEGAKTLPPVSRHAINVGLFDAMFQ